MRASPDRIELALLVALFLLFVSCGSTPRDQEMRALSKDHRVLAQDRLGFRLHDVDEAHGFLRVTLRVHLHEDQRGERFTARLRIRNDGPRDVVVDLAGVAFELGGESTIRWRIAKAPLDGAAELFVPPSTAATAKVHFDVHGLSRWPLGVPVAVRVPYRVGDEGFEIRVPFVKAEASSFGRTIVACVLLPPTFALGLGLDLASGGIEWKDGKTDSVALRMIGNLFSGGSSARPLEVATRVRLSPSATRP